MRTLEDYDTEAYNYLLDLLGREPTDEEIEDYIQQQDALAEDNAYDLAEAEATGN